MGLSYYGKQINPAGPVHLNFPFDEPLMPKKIKAIIPPLSLIKKLDNPKINFGEGIERLLLENQRDEDDLDRHVSRMLKQHGQLDKISAGVLEINPTHDLIKSLALKAKQNGASDELEHISHLLLDQARILEGDLPSDPAAFSQRLTIILKKGL